MHVNYRREDNSQAKQTAGSETSREWHSKDGVKRGDGDIRKNCDEKGGIILNLKIGVIGGMVHALRPLAQRGEGPLFLFLMTMEKAFEMPT